MSCTKLSDLSALSHSHLRYFAASLIADQLSAKALADAVMAIPIWRQPLSSWRTAPGGAMAASKKPLPPLGSPHCCERDRCFDHMAVAVTLAKGDTL